MPIEVNENRLVVPAGSQSALHRNVGT